MFFVNLHELPAGKSLYTLLVHNGRGMYDELDVVAGSFDTPIEICRQGKAFLADHEGQHVVAIADQSSGNSWDLGDGIYIGEDGTV